MFGRCLVLSSSSYLLLLPMGYLWYLFWVSVDYGSLFTVIYLGVAFLYSFYDLILITDSSTLRVQECDQSVLVCVSTRCLNSSWNSVFFDPIRVASTLGSFLVIISFLSTSTSSLMLLITSLWSLPMLTWLTTVTSVTMSSLVVRM